jgi:eukaryotic-like serine/threonine-protein kinase
LPRPLIPRFEREARAISSLNHPHICILYDVGPNYLVMELVEGETLAARLKTGPLPTELVFEYGRQIAEALMEAHAKGIIHRDLKPGNIMIAKLVNKIGIKVLDFGLAKTGDETLTQTNAIMGTPAYMAPEQLRGQTADARTDIYAFGLVLYEMATGKRLGPGQTKLAGSLPEKLARVIERCVKDNPDERWQSAGELVAELEPGTAAPPAAVSKRGKWIAAAAVAALAFGTAGFYYFHRAPKLTDKDTIVLADFTNTTTDPVFDDTLRQGLAAELEQSPFLSLVPDERIQATLGLMKQPPGAKLTPDIAKGVCERIGSAAVLEGSIAPLGSRYVLGLRAERCRGGEVLDEEQAQDSTKEDVLNVLGPIASKFRAKVGESLASVKEHETPLPEVTTPSIEALEAYSKARKLAYSTGYIDAVPEAKRAVMLDGEFARAYSFLGDMYSGIGESVLAAEPATAKDSPSTCCTTRESRETWKRRKRPVSCGNKPILAKLTLTAGFRP